MTGDLDLTALADGLGPMVKLGGAQTLTELTDAVNAICDQVESRAEKSVVVFQLVAISPDSREWPGNVNIATVNRWERAVHRIERLTAASVAVAQGTCGGPALDLLLATDFRIGSPDLRLMLPVNDGHFWPGMAIYRLVQQVGLARARQIVLWGTDISLTSACDLGLIDRVSEDIPEAVRTAKILIGRISDRELTVRRQLLLEADSVEYGDALGVHLAACDRELRRLRSVGAVAPQADKGADMVLLNRSELHDSVGDPVLGSIGFLNEVMSRYPDAISFAPGAPHTRFIDDLDIEPYIDAFVNHLVRDKGYSQVRARRLLFEYGPSRGLINHLVADALRRDQGIAATPAAVVITVGAQEAMLLALRALFRPASGDVLAVANPCFVGITGAARLLDIPLVSVRETDDGIDLAALDAACLAANRSGERIRACYVAADFSNPGGGRMSLECRRELLELAQSRDFLILEDNAYGFTAADGMTLPCLKALDTGRRVIHIGTFAKVCFPGARVGYVVADQPVKADGNEQLLADDLAALKSVVTVNTSAISQAVIGGMLLKHGSLSGLAGPKSQFYRGNLTSLLAAMDRHLADGLPPGVAWNRPAGGFFVRVKLPVRADLDLLKTSAAKYGVLWTPMSQFFLDGAGDFQLRLSCSYLDSDAIEEGMRRLAAFLKMETWS